MLITRRQQTAASLPAMGEIVHLTRDEISAFPVGEITIGGKVVQAGETVATAWRTFASSAVKLLPVLDGGRYLGAVDRPALEGADGEAPVAAYARPLVPVERASTRAADALAGLDAHGATRLVVVGEDGRYVGLVCLRGSRERLCIDAARLRALA